MNLETNINTSLKFALANGFNIVRSEDFGMAKFCLLKYSILEIEVWNDRDDFDSILKYENKSFNLFHLANFLNGKTKKYNKDYSIFDINRESYLRKLDKLIEKEIDNILDFLFNLTNEKEFDFEAYFNQETSL